MDIGNKAPLEYRNIAEFNRGQSSRVFKEVSESNVPYVVMKNGKPIAVIISYEKYCSLIRDGVNFSD